MKGDEKQETAWIETKVMIISFCKLMLFY